MYPVSAVPMLDAASLDQANWFRISDFQLFLQPWYPKLQNYPVPICLHLALVNGWASVPQPNHESQKWLQFKKPKPWLPCRAAKIYSNKPFVVIQAVALTKSGNESDLTGNRKPVIIEIKISFSSMGTTRADGEDSSARLAIKITDLARLPMMVT